MVKWFDVGQLNLVCMPIKLRGKFLSGKGRCNYYRPILMCEWTFSDNKIVIIFSEENICNVRVCVF